jgi:transposase
LVAALDGGERFRKRRHAESYLGLVPREARSG